MAALKHHTKGSTTFRLDEVQWLDQLFRMIERIPDTEVLRRHKAYRSIWQKVQRMKGRYAEGNCSPQWREPRMEK